MDPIVWTPRLKLTLITTAERGSPEFTWIHALRSDQESMFWSISGAAKSEEDTAKFAHRYLTVRDEKEGIYAVAYAVHEILVTPFPSEAQSESSTGHDAKQTRFIGIVNMSALQANDLKLPEHLGPPAAAAGTTVTTNLAYFFLPAAWGKGYGAEALDAMFGACHRARSFWSPYSQVFAQAKVNVENPRSQRVMDKIGMQRLGVFEWSGEPVFVAGQWRDKDSIVIYGKNLLD